MWDSVPVGFRGALKGGGKARPLYVKSFRAARPAADAHSVPSATAESSFMSVVPNAWELRGAPEDRDTHVAEARGRERGAEFLHWLRSEAEARPVTPLEAFRFAFHEGPDALHAAAKAEAEAAASMHAHARRAIGDAGGNGSSAPESTAAAAARQRRVAANLADPPPNLSAFAGRMWTAFCEADVDSCDALTRVQFEAALASLQLSASPAEAAARWRAAGRDKHSGRLPWTEFKRLANQYKSVAEAAARRAEETKTAAKAAAERFASTRIQATARGHLTRKQVLRQQKEAQRREREALVKVRAAEVYAGGVGGVGSGSGHVGGGAGALTGSRLCSYAEYGSSLGGAHNVRPAPSRICSRPASRTSSRPSSLPTSPSRRSTTAGATVPFVPYPALGSGGGPSTPEYHSWPVLPAEPLPLAKPHVAAEATAAARQRAMEADEERRRLEVAHRQQLSDMDQLRAATVELMSELDAERAK